MKLLKRRKEHFRKKLIRQKQMNCFALKALQEIDSFLDADGECTSDFELRMISTRSTVKDALRTLAKMKKAPYKEKPDGIQA